MFSIRYLTKWKRRKIVKEQRYGSKYCFPIVYDSNISHKHSLTIPPFSSKSPSSSPYNYKHLASFFKNTGLNRGAQGTGHLMQEWVAFLWQSHEHAASVWYFCVWLFQFDNLKVFGRGWYMVGYDWQIELIETGGRVKTNLQFVVELFSASTFGAI